MAKSKLFKFGATAAAIGATCLAGAAAFGLRDRFTKDEMIELDRENEYPDEEDEAE